jgi:hypothetical protein
MSPVDKLTPTVLKSLISTLFQEESAVILIVDKDDQEKILDFRIEPLPEVIALLALSGYGTPVGNILPGVKS